MRAWKSSRMSRRSSSSSASQRRISMPSAARSGAISSRKQRACSRLRRWAMASMTLRTLCGRRPEEVRTGRPVARRRMRPATRTMKNSSRLDEKMDRKRTRSSSGSSGDWARRRTRPLKRSQLSSRSRNRSGGGFASARGAGSLFVMEHNIGGEREHPVNRFRIPFVFMASPIGPARRPVFPPRLFPGAPVDALAQEVGVAVVARVLLDHVEVDPAQAGGPVVRVLEGVVEAVATGGLLRVVDGGPEALEDLGRIGPVGLVEIGVGVPLVPVVGQVLSPLPVHALAEPVVLHFGEVADEAEEGETRGLHGGAFEPLLVEPGALRQEGVAVVIEESFEEHTLGGGPVGLGAGDLGRGPCHSVRLACRVVIGLLVTRPRRGVVRTASETSAMSDREPDSLDDKDAFEWIDEVEQTQRPVKGAMLDTEGYEDDRHGTTPAEERHGPPLEEEL